MSPQSEPRSACSPNSDRPGGFSLRGFATCPSATWHFGIRRKLHTPEPQAGCAVAGAELALEGVAHRAAQIATWQIASNR